MMLKDRDVKDLNLVLAVGLASAALVLFLAVVAMGGALQAGLAPWPGIGLVALAIAAFAASWRLRSFLVAGLLVASGMVGLVYGLIATDFFSIIVFPGPIIGVISGIGVLGLGAAKGIEAARSKSRTATTSI
jgi:hypothetical protein